MAFNPAAVEISRSSQEQASTGDHSYTSEDSDVLSLSASRASGSTSQDTMPTDLSSLAGNSDSPNGSVTCERQGEALGIDFLNQGQTFQSGLMMQESLMLLC